jgi:thiosulfate dehydrogenase (quinone) large subunit
MNVNVPVLGDPSAVKTPGVLRWLSTSRIAAVAWAAGRCWLGVQWLNAGRSKLWGAENASFMHHNGAGVAGFAQHGAATYTWWHSFLTGFVVPNSGWIGILVAVAEFVIGIALIIGIFTPLFAFGGLLLNTVYMLTGTAGVNPVFMLFSILLIVAWRNSGWLGADGLLMRYLQRRHAETPAVEGGRTRHLLPHFHIA